MTNFKPLLTQPHHNLNLDKYKLFYKLLCYVKQILCPCIVMTPYFHFSNSDFFAFQQPKSLPLVKLTVYSNWQYIFICFFKCLLFLSLALLQNSLSVLELQHPLGPIQSKIVFIHLFKIINIPHFSSLLSDLPSVVTLSVVLPYSWKFWTLTYFSY